jgi:hypothetical protein
MIYGNINPFYGISNICRTFASEFRKIYQELGNIKIIRGVFSTDFSPNNQKKTQKKSQTCHIFFDLDWVWNAEMAIKRYMEKNMPYSSSFNCF